MKAVLISIRPRWCDLIVSGKKTIEVRKTRPRIGAPFKCYIYQTKKPVRVSFSGSGRHIAEYDKTLWYTERSGKVIGEFVCDHIFQYTTTDIKDGTDIGDREIQTMSCLSYAELAKYENSSYSPDALFDIIGLFGWHISDLIIYDKPKKLSDFSATWETVKKRLQGKMWVPMEDMDGTIKRPPQIWCYVEAQ